MKQINFKHKAILVMLLAMALFSSIGFAQSTYLLDELKPFSTTGWYWEFGSTVKTTMGGGNSMTMGGKKYTNGFKFGEPGTATFNLSGKYAELSGEIGLDDFENKKDTGVSFYGDGKLIAYVELKAQMLPKKFSVDVRGVSQLQIKKETGYSEVNLAGLSITKQDTPVTTKVVEPTAPLKDGVYLLDVLTPYDKGRFYWPFGKASKSSLGGENSMTMGGKQYLNGFKLGEPGYAIFNFEGKYKTLVATVGLDDFENKKSTAVEFFGDGVLIQKVDLLAGMLPKEIRLDVTGVSKFEIKKTVGYAEVNLAEIQVSKNASAVTKPTTTLAKLQSVVLDTTKTYDRPTKIDITLKENASPYKRDSKNALAPLSEIEVLNNNLVAVGTDGIIYASTDKVTWNVSNANTFDDLSDIAYGGGKYLVASSLGYLS